MSPSLRAMVATALAMGALVSLPRLPWYAPADAAAVTTAGAGGGQANADTLEIRAEGEKIAVPGADGCFIHVTAWENGTWVDESPRDGPRLQQGKPTDTSTAKSDVAEIKRWLEVLLAQSEDMRAKTKAACEKTDKKFIQIAVVRDDPKAGPGTALVGTPLILVDIGDTEKLGQAARTSGTENASLETSARMTVMSFLPVTIIVHEIDHMKRTDEDMRLFSPETIEGFAMDDENRVAVELENFRPHKTDLGFSVRRLERTRYTPVVYTYRPFRDVSIRVELDVAGAGLAFERREGARPRFTELSDDGERALDGVSSSQTVEGLDADLDGIGNVHDNCPHAWNPRQHDGNGDGVGDHCDPEMMEGHRVTDALVASAVDAVKQAASLAGGAPHLALIGPDDTGAIRFVRLADVWPFVDSFGIFRSPGIGDLGLYSLIRAAFSLRLMRLFSDSFGILSAAGVGTRAHDLYPSAATALKVQLFAARLRTFSAGSAFGAAIIIPVWVDPPPQAGWRRLPSATAAGQPWMLAAVHPGPGGPGGGSPAAVALRESGALGSRAPGRRLLPRAEHGVGRPSSSNAARGADQRAAAPGAQGAQRQTNEPPRPSVKLFFVSTGQTTGTAFKMTAVNDGNVPVWLMLDTFALKPLANVTAADVERQMKPFAGRGRVTMDVDGYCLDFPKQPPPAGMVFGLADDTLQAAMDPIDRIAHAVVRLRALGRLQPDTKDATEYAHDMVQWSIWTLREGFDDPRFTRAFVEHVRKNFVAAGDRWTRDLERTVAALAPARWRVIQTILRESGVLPRP